MEMSNHTCGCQGSKLGHHKTRTSSASSGSSATSASAATTTSTQSNAANTTATRQNRIIVHNYARAAYTNDNMRGTFKLPGYESTKLERLPAAPQTLFQKEQLLGMLDDFSKHMYDAILQNGISVPPSINLGLNSMGDINLLGTHPDQAKIESLFGDNSPLALQFHQIAFTSRIQQLANMQPGFRGDFFKYPTNSIQQITFVHMRAVDLKPFQMTIDQPETTANPALDNQAQNGAINLFHLIISRSKDISALSSATDNQAPSKPEGNLYTIDEPAPPKTAQPEPRKEERHQAVTGNRDHSIPEEHRFTIDDPVPPKTAQAESHSVHKHHHVHKGKMRCVINS
jgi:hypothetical protein